MIHTVKGFAVVNKPEVDIFPGILLLFLWSSRCWQFDPSSYALSKFSLNIWKFTVHVLLKPGLENFEHYFASVWDECNCALVWVFFGIGMKTDLFQSCGWLFYTIAFEIVQQSDAFSVERLENNNNSKADEKLQNIPIQRTTLISQFFIINVPSIHCDPSMFTRGELLPTLILKYSCKS